MWTPATRRQHSRAGLRYASDLTDDEWRTLEPLLPAPPRRGRRRAWPLRETAETLADHDPPLLATTIGQRIAFADVVQSGRLAAEQDDTSPAAREITALAAEVARFGA